MVYNNQLTAAQKDKKLPVIIERDGDVCYFDLEPFFQQIPGMRRTFDHLNDDARDNRIENLGLCHHSCNVKKRDDFDMKFIALTKLRENILNVSKSLGEGEGQKRTDTGLDELTEGQVNQIINKIVNLELETQLPESSIDKTISYNKTLKGIHYLVIKQTGGMRGSEQASRRALDAYCSMYAPWKDEKQGRGNRIIRRRQPEEFGK